MNFRRIQEKLDRPLACLDVEATGLDWTKDRIVSLAIIEIVPYGEPLLSNFFINPGILMSEENIAVHGITNERAAKWPFFHQYAKRIHEILTDKDICGFNLMGLDVPMLWEELYRNGIEWDLCNVRMVDAGQIYKIKEPRTLSAGVQFYLNHEHTEAHQAQGDVEATIEVLDAQFDRYLDIDQLTIDELHELCKRNDRIDLAGKILMGSDGRPIYNIGRAKGIAVEDDVGMAQWMLDRDFPEHTKMVLRKILRDLNEPKRALSIPLESSNVPIDSEEMPF